MVQKTSSQQTTTSREQASTVNNSTTTKVILLEENMMYKVYIFSSHTKCNTSEIEGKTNMKVLDSFEL